MASSEWRIQQASWFSYSLFATPYSPLALLPFLAERADFHFKGPGAARLLIELPIGCCNRGGGHQQVGIVPCLLSPGVFTPLAPPGRIHPGIDDQMRDVDVFGPQLARHRLRHGAESEFRAGKGSKTGPAAQRSRRAGEEDVAPAPRQHQPRRFAAREKAGPAGHLPDFSKHA